MVTAEIPESLARFEIPGRLVFQEGNGELVKMAITSDASTAEVYLHGAHVTGFQKKGEAPLLFLSQFSRYEARQPIRGGIPIIFPWFGPREGEQTHGFARTSEWCLHEATTVPEGGVSLRFGLPLQPEAGFCPRFLANYVVTVTDRLTLELILTNVSPGQDCEVENCLHTYFQVGDIEAVSILGLEGAGYLDQMENFAPKTPSQAPLKIAAEVDRIYPDAASAVEIVDERLRRKIRVEKSGSLSTVVWNPWIAKAQRMPDFGNDEYRQMICVESGNVAQNRRVLPPGQSAVLKVILSTEPL